MRVGACVSAVRIRVSRGIPRRRWILFDQKGGPGLETGLGTVYDRESSDDTDWQRKKCERRTRSLEHANLRDARRMYDKGDVLLAGSREEATCLEAHFMTQRALIYSIASICFCNHEGSADDIATKDCGTTEKGSRARED